MICELRNKAAMLCVYIMEGKNHEGYPYVESETTLGKCILWVLFCRFDYYIYRMVAHSIKNSFHSDINKEVLLQE